jgi:hypothetical protein
MKLYCVYLLMLAIAMMGHVGARRLAKAEVGAKV